MIGYDNKLVQAMTNPQANQIQQITPEQYGQAQADMQKSKQLQAMAAALAGKQYGASQADVIAALVDGFARAKAMKQSDEKWSSAYERAMKYEQQEKERASQAAADAEARKREDAIADYETKLKLKGQYAATPAPKKSDVFGHEGKLRDAYTKDTATFAGQNDSYGRIIASAKDPSPAGDLALIFNYMKVLDPGSTVREGEFANAQNAGSVPERVSSLYNNVMKGTRLTEEQRYDFIKRATDLYGQARSDYQKRADVHRGIAGQYGEFGVDPERVIYNRALYNPEDVMAGFQAPQGAPMVTRALKGPNGESIEAVIKNGQWVNAQTGEAL